jgi:four helix bundle protein
VGDYRSLKVWERAHRLTLRVYEVTTTFPSSERYGLTSQIRRSASSIPANVAEGCGRNSDAELARFCRIAQGSPSELDYHLLLARDLGYLPEDVHSETSGDPAQLRRMLASFVETVASKPDRW